MPEKINLPEGYAAPSPHRSYYYGWNIVGVGALAQATAYGVIFSCFSLFLPYWSHDLHVPISVMAVCYTCSGAIYALSAPLAGIAADRFSIRLQMTVGMLIMIAFFLLASQARAAWQLIALFSILAPFGLSFGGMIPTPVLVARWFERRRNLALGLSFFGLSGAGALLAQIIGRGLPVVGWRTIFLIAAGFAALVTVPLILLVIRNPRAEEGLGFERSAAEAREVAEQEGVTTRQLLMSTNFWIMVALMVFVNFSQFGYGVNLAPLAESRGLSVGETATLLSALGLAALVATLLVGAGSDKLGARPVMILALIISVAGLGLAISANSFPLLLLATTLVGVAGGAAVPIAGLMAREFGVGAVGRAMGFATVSIVLAVTAPPIVAYMRETTGGYESPLLLLLVLTSMAAACMLAFRDHGPTRG